MIKPPFKWAGGKTKMLKAYEPLIQDALRTSEVFIDAFFGAGAMSLYVYDLYPHIDIVAIEHNAEMTAVYKAMGNIDAFIEELDKIAKPYEAASFEERYDYYYAQRERYAFGDNSDIVSAALLFFMLRTCFNGIWVTRVFLGNKFGTPVGGRKERKVYDETQLREFADFLKNITFITGDFEEARKHVKGESFIYCDPPYRDSFTPYGGGFDDSEQTRLVLFMDEMADNAHNVAMSNKLGHDDFWDNSAIRNWNRHLFNVKYTATRSAEAKKAVEVLFTNF